jgi:PAS domain S-box-containing protein
VGRLTNDLFREIVSLSSNAVLVVDVTSGKLRIVFANPAYEELSGFSADELEGTSWLEYAATDVSSPEFQRLTAAAASAEPGSHCLPFFGREGEIWAADLKLLPLTSGASKSRLLLVEHTGTSDAIGRSEESSR